MTKKLLLIGPKDGIGGHVTYVKEVVRHGFEGFEIAVFNTARKKRLIAKKHETEAFVFRKTNIFILLWAGIGVVWNVLKFFALILVRRPDCILITGGRNIFWEQMWFIMLAKLFRIKAVLHYHGPFYEFWGDSGKGMRHRIKFIYGLLDKLMVLSERDRQCALEILPDNKVVVMPNYVAQEEYSWEFSGKPSAQDSITRIIFLGGINPIRKGINDLIKVLNQMTNEVQHARFIFPGGPEVEQHLKKDLNNNARNAVDFVGWISSEEKKKLFDQADIMLLPSYNEGLPYALIEAMASGMAVISTDVGGIPDLVPSVDHGILIKPGDTQALKSGLLSLIQDRKLCESMGRNNIDRIKKYYTQDIVFNRMSKIFNEVLAQ